jgi:hypothetical protein
MFTRVLGSRCVLPLSISLNLGYRYYAHHLYEKTGPIYRDPIYMAEAAAKKHASDAASSTTTRSCGAASATADFVELGIL